MALLPAFVAGTTDALLDVPLAVVLVTTTVVLAVLGAAALARLGARTEVHAARLRSERDTLAAESAEFAERTVERFEESVDGAENPATGLDLGPGGARVTTGSTQRIGVGTRVVVHWPHRGSTLDLAGAVARAGVRPVATNSASSSTSPAPTPTPQRAWWRSSRPCGPASASDSPNLPEDGGGGRGR